MKRKTLKDRIRKLSRRVKYGYYIKERREWLYITEWCLCQWENFLGTLYDRIYNRQVWKEYKKHKIYGKFKLRYLFKRHHHESPIPSEYIEIVKRTPKLEKDIKRIVNKANEEGDKIDYLPQLKHPLVFKKKC